MVLENRFVPKPAPGVDLSRHYPVVSATAVAGIPEFVRESFGVRVLNRANRDALLDLNVVTDHNSFIPHAVMCRFAESIERQTGHSDYGLLLAPHLSIENYGCWGEYVLGATTLQAAAKRVVRSLRFHSIGDRFEFCVEGEMARIAYRSAAKGKPGYSHVACGILGVLLSFCRAYLTRQWAPVRIELDIPRPARSWHYEETLGCPVVFDAASPAVWLETYHLSARKTDSSSGRRLTVCDLAQSRGMLSSADLLGVVMEQVRLQLFSGSVSIERVALTLDTSVRSLQRDLNRDGTSFRDLTGAVRLRRARNLLAETTLSVTEIAADLGYSSPAHFARAFRKITGLSPTEFRAAVKF
ncbi:hypothetical protein AUC70_04515 [Methyloceanibacter stevinii]|uniref:HTH araC/xylS-type domain-containing protein n=1 Tax=Methyloceanibacter stevinii TaxID=1774970 RepID=A0A1E3VNA5_9HYPH|nr:AraC family transcriptional regulator [Methyloceanibacter stevinii]ODR95018.1 hypothetical protein AUC70_04515 [Methyloceanibacter stevinii]